MNRIHVLVAAVIGVAIVLIGAAPAVAGNGVTHVAGLLTPDTAAVCAGDPGNQGAYVASGTLDGCWYVDTFANIRTTPGGGFYADGTETFVGCLNSDCGRLFTTFSFTAKYDGASEVHGRCHHPIVGGDGDFAGATGVINMHDLPNGCSVYKGTLSY